MAAAEARAAWQRTANRYFVQEDAKRAPKLACCQSSAASSKQVDIGPVNAADGTDHPAIGFMPSNMTPNYSNLPTDAKWWLHTQPNYGHQRCLNFEQCNTRTVDVETTPSVTITTDSQMGESDMLSEESIRGVEYEDLVESFLDVKKHPESKFEELELVDGKADQDFLDLKNMTEYYESLEMEMVGGSVSKRNSGFSSKADSSFMHEGKVPWWRVMDETELASFVAHKSLHHVENCDLPPPQKVRNRREPCKQAGSIDHDEMFVSSTGGGVQNDVISTPSSGGSQRKHWSSVKVGLPQNENATTEPLRANNDAPDKAINSVSDPCKAQLLEALCHSQTRAREAEKAAKQAHTEKEDLLKLFFRQASQLFAYKQWFKLLQLENYLQQTNDNGEKSSPYLTAFPDFLPWVPDKTRKVCKNWQKCTKAKRRKRNSQGNEIGKYAVAFALGFTLVGAGLILGWTVGSFGWFLPGF